MTPAPILLPIFFLAGLAVGTTLGLAVEHAQTQDLLSTQDQALRSDIKLLHQASATIEDCSKTSEGLAQALWAQQESIAAAPKAINEGDCWRTQSSRTFCYQAGAIRPQEPKP